jgi:hypothetical protein
VFARTRIAASVPAHLLYSRVFRTAASAMIELNPVRDQIADLKQRIAALRGYL